MTSTVAYPNPLDQWLWESGTIYWIYLLVGAPFLLILFILYGRLFIRSLRKRGPLPSTYEKRNLKRMGNE